MKKIRNDSKTQGANQMTKNVERARVGEKENSGMDCIMFDYLDALRESGVTNMYGARPYLMDEFNLTRKHATFVLTTWMQTYSQRHPQPADAPEHRSTENGCEEGCEACK
jgi:hypothetical protein